MGCHFREIPLVMARCQTGDITNCHSLEVTAIANRWFGKCQLSKAAPSPPPTENGIADWAQLQGSTVRARSLPPPPGGGDVSVASPGERPSSGGLTQLAAKKSAQQASASQSAGRLWPEKDLT